MRASLLGDEPQFLFSLSLPFGLLKYNFCVADGGLSFTVISTP